ncbi:MAG: hypothetical protein J6T09_04410, partial [Bacteroidales bacterium]|nr:hypothetical protein [Bacteroidales bacterium]
MKNESYEEDPEFQERMEEFLKSLETNTDTDDFDDNDDEELYDEDELYDNELYDDDDEHFGNDDDMNDYQVGTGQFTLGQNNKVKVEILQPLTNPREELNNLVGCNDIRKRIDELLDLNNYNVLMRAFCPDSKPHATSLHSLFFG